MFNRRSARWQRQMALKLDFNYMMSDFAGPRHGVSVQDLAGLSEENEKKFAGLLSILEQKARDEKAD